MLKLRLEKFHENIICEDFIVLYNLKNISNLPRFESLTLSSTSISFSANPIVVMQSFGAWLLETSQKGVKTRARQSIALFEIRKDNLLGLKVTCRKRVCFSLLDKCLIWVLPRLLSVSNPSKMSVASPKALQKDKSFRETVQLQKTESVFGYATGSAEPISMLSRTQRKTIRTNRRFIRKISVGLSSNRANTASAKGDKPTRMPTDQLIGFTKSQGLWRRRDEICLQDTKQPINVFTASQKRWTQLENNKTTLRTNDKMFYTISHNSARFFPERSCLDLFFDKVAGFSLSCSITALQIKHSCCFSSEAKPCLKGSPKALWANKAEANKILASPSGHCRLCSLHSEQFSESSRVYQKSDNESIKKQWISAFQLPMSIG